MPPAPDDTLLVVDSLGIEFDVDGQTVSAVRDASFEVRRGEVLAVVGESGSGKSVTAMALLGLLPGNATVTGSIRFDGEELLDSSRSVLRELRGRRIAMIFQDPQATLNPVFTVGFQIAEAVRRNASGLSRAEVDRRVVELLSLVEIPEPERRAKSYPHQLSGGQCQRVVIAIALAGDPDLLVADEPTTALDVTVQAEVLDVLRRMRARLDSSILIITHDMGVVADIADRVVVMRTGEIVETQDVAELYRSPQHDYSRALLEAVPQLGGGAGRPPAELADAPVLEVENLVVEYRAGLRSPFRAVDSVDLSVRRGEILALVGESGSGKTTLGLATVGLAPITSGDIRVAGTSIAGARRAERRAMRRQVGVVFQNPATSLNPRYSVAQTVSEPLRVIAGIRGAELDDRVDTLLESVGLGPAWRDRYPHELSGGQRQRIAIARAVALDPAVLIADEPTSALDVSVQARVLEVFRELQERLGFACLFITHDLAVVDELADSMVVMNKGRVVEHGPRDQVLGSPREEYTRALVAAAPVADPVLQRQRREARRIA
ncbi:MAG: ABC transporter ATP-binding protein [Microbacteriaceae bacterium]